MELSPNDRFSDVPTGDLSRDANGWLTELPLLNGVAQPDLTNVVYTQLLKRGQHILEWDGEGDVRVDQNAKVIGPNKLLINYDPTYLNAQRQPTDDGFTLRIGSSDPNNNGNHVHNIPL